MEIISKCYWAKPHIRIKVLELKMADCTLQNYYNINMGKFQIVIIK